MISQSIFCKENDGEAIDLYTCTNKNGLVLRMINFGATLLSLDVPDSNMKIENVTLGYKTPDDFLAGKSYFGSTVGRYCNRIASAKFSLGETEYTLSANDGENHLHGGHKGFDKVVWDAESFSNGDGSGINFEYESVDGEEGYPGNLKVSAKYKLTDNDELKIELSAITDKPTTLNLTNHTFWNLSGVAREDILNHELTIFSEKFLAVDNGLIPTGELIGVEDTPFDFTSFRMVREEIRSIPIIEGLPQGYDHCFVLKGNARKLKPAAILRHLSSGRKMEIQTTQPSIQFYSGNFLDGSQVGGGFEQYYGLCLETQHYPDSPNQPIFPTTILMPGEKYSHLTVHSFSTV